MKRFIFATLIAAAFSFSAMPGVALAKHHHRRYHRVVYYRSAAPRSHGADVNGNVGVGLGPIHVGVGAGGGIHLHAFPTPRMEPTSDPMSANDPPASTKPWVDEQLSANGHFIVHPSDCDLECYVNTNAAAPTSAAFVDTASDVIWSSNSSGIVGAPYSGVPYRSERFTLSPDTNVNNYFVTYVPRPVVTVGGFNVPITGSSMYYSPFKRGRNSFWYVHNRKGLDVTADHGVSPRAGPIPESIGGIGYTVTTVEQ